MAKNLFIPPLGTEIVLAEPWTFDLFRESRNETLIETMGIEFPDVNYYERSKQFETVTLPAGSVLKVDRIYVRKGQSSFDSVTFCLKGHSRPGYTWVGKRWDGRDWTYKVSARGVRFWVKLHDANKIVMEG